MRRLAGILLVDDDATSNFLNARLLQRVAPTSRLLMAENGAQGLHLLHRVLAQPVGAEPAPWLVLLDMRMPVLDGFAFLEAFQHLPVAQRERIAVVVLTTSLPLLDLERLQALPVSSFVPKPLTEAKLTTLLRDLQRGPTSVPPGPAAAVFQLLYHSQATKPLGETEFYQLLSQARQGNAARQITGLLVYQQGYYVQVLEGPEAQVRALYARIEQDPRHTHVVTVYEAADRPRFFAHWRMALGHATVPVVARLFEVLLAPGGVGGAALAETLRQISTTLERPRP
ncbi:BLUF domain-containing protein [Hymenobacter sp. YC55]|uniref:BLUF domain-containing protein n=1 Tax=Hymenobacter sp. YC55 TaxID=3034019 RepID=UPI0023F9B014|nr:BLUF domain-containing protein [Hymenobacter sp. YC55]MDF7815710.1 BLUF domain-containing protein [Hymenobacter sp. YC55]